MRSSGTTHLILAGSASLVLASGLFLAASLLAPAAQAVGVCPDQPQLRERPVHLLPGDVPHDELLNTSEGCPTWRWVALQSDSSTTCPVPEATSGGFGWRVRLLFAEHAEEAEARTIFETLPGGLRSFCVYSTDQTEDAVRSEMNDNLVRLLQRGELRQVQSGCAAVAPMSKTRNYPNFEPLKEQFYSRTGSIRTLGLPSLGFGEENDPNVRLTFVDTQPSALTTEPTDDSDFANSPHGLALMRLADGLICTGYPRRCAAEITAALGLPIVTFHADDFTRSDIDRLQGGRFGTIDQIAQGVWEALDAWEASDEQHLIINLSVAWVGEHYGGLEAEVRHMPLSVQALYRTLEVASCREALIVAAAGNSVGGPEIESGPLMPAAWERRPAPTDAQCNAIESRSSDYRDLVSQDVRVPEREAGSVPSGDALAVSYGPGVEPLVFAAAGIHADGVPLVNARPDSQPPRVAFSDHAAVSGVRPMGLPTMPTGSSVAATVVSSAAAAIWHHLPDLPRSEVMALLDDSGQALRRRADFYLGDADGARTRYVSEIRVCRALAHALGARCDSPDGCPIPDCPELVQPVRLPGELDGCVSIELAKPEDLDEVSQDYCGRQMFVVEADLLASQTAATTSPCPFRQYYGVCARPWGCPQPEGNPCLHCNIDPPPSNPMSTSANRSLRIYIDPEWSPVLHSMTLGIGDHRFPLIPTEDNTSQAGTSQAGTSQAGASQNGDPKARDLKEAGCFEITEIPHEYLEPKNGVLPTTALYFHSEEGSVEAPVYLDR